MCIYGASSSQLSLVGQKCNNLFVRKVFWILLLSGVSFTATAQTVVNDPNAVKFKIKNFGVWVEGSFSGLKGEIRFDPLDPTNALFDVTIDATSIETGIDLRDKHLRKEEYMDIKNYPLLKFTSSSDVKGDKQNVWILSGHLTIKRITKEISFPFLFEQKDGHNLFLGEFMVNRRDFSVGGKSLSMADELRVILNVQN